MMNQKKYYCNPINVNYRYQFHTVMNSDVIQAGREGADPSLICYQGKYYLFASMTLGVWVSEDLVNWENHRLPDSLPLYDYAPDVRVMGEYVYFSASAATKNCSFYRTKDVIYGPYEEIAGSFPFWDPNLFVDDDGRVYFYWGCDNDTPIWGVELDPVTMHPVGETKELVFGDALTKGYERIGEDHTVEPCSEEEVEIKFQAMLEQSEQAGAELPEYLIPKIRSFLSNRPYIEGPWMDKHNGVYYLQYAFAGTEYNIYGDGVYVGDSPLGSFRLAENNPYSYAPGGFFPGAGHGSTMEDRWGNLWHTATMRISKNYNCERRVGLWPAGFDPEGELFCNQRYGTWPVCVEQLKQNPWRNPDWYLLSYGKPVKVSSFEEGKGPELAVDENVQTWWRAAGAGAQWIELDLGKACDVRAVQINFADDKIEIPVSGRLRTETEQARYIEEAAVVTRWRLEGSVDGEEYFLLEDKSQAESDLSHDFLVWESGISLRFLRLTVLEVPYGQPPAVSGLRVFGIGTGEKPAVPVFRAKRIGDLDMEITIENKPEGARAVGYNILWGHRPDKLYHSYMIMGKAVQRIGALVKGRNYFVRVDAFNEAGITKGKVTETEI